MGPEQVRFLTLPKLQAMMPALIHDITNKESTTKVHSEFEVQKAVLEKGMGGRIISENTHFSVVLQRDGFWVVYSERPNNLPGALMCLIRHPRTIALSLIAGISTHFVFGTGFGTGTGRIPVLGVALPVIFVATAFTGIASFFECRDFYGTKSKKYTWEEAKASCGGDMKFEDVCIDLMNKLIEDAHS